MRGVWVALKKCLEIGGHLHLVAYVIEVLGLHRFLFATATGATGAAWAWYRQETNSPLTLVLGSAALTVLVLLALHLTELLRHKKRKKRSRRQIKGSAAQSTSVNTATDGIINRTLENLVENGIERGKIQIRHDTVTITIEVGPPT